MIYLLHFSTPIAPGKHTTQHYIGFCDHDLDARLNAHRAGRGARLCQVARARGITFQLVRVWSGDRTRERRLKNRHEGPRLCPICNANARRLATPGTLTPGMVRALRVCPF